MSVQEILIFVACTSLGWFALRRLRRPLDEKTQPESKLIRTHAPEVNSRRVFSRFDQWFGRIVRLDRLPWEPTVVAVMIGGLAIVTAAAVFVWTEQTMPTIMAALFAMLASLVALQVAFYRMVAQFERQLPLALDLMARAVSAGESLDQAIHLVSESMEEPARTEFLRCHNQLAMGLSVRAAMGSMVYRIDTLNVRIMGSILSVHRDTGGNLAETLHRLASVIRKRFDYHRRLRTVTGAGRVSLFIVIALASSLSAYLFIGQPEYGKQFFDSALGKKMLVVAFLLELIGVVWGWLLLKKKY